jgi:transcription initiation factor TFIIIB Brf1 subunit/transcription initiation factor TFIIB
MQAAQSGLGLVDSEDDSLKALNLILEAWETGSDSGIAPELLAYAAIYTALTDLVAAYGEDHVSRLVDGLKPRVMRGEFTLYRNKQ